MKWRDQYWVILLFVVFSALYLTGVLSWYWTLMFSAIFIVVGFVLGVLLMGSGSENQKMGLPLLIFGILLLLLIMFFPR